MPLLSTEIKYLGYIISPDGTSMDPSKISAVQDWPAPKKLLKKDVPFSWRPEQEASFKRLKDAFARPGFLAHPNDEQPFILETDASDFAISGVLHQHDQSNTLRPVAFYSRQMNNAERNYDIYDKELLAVVESFKHWRHLLQGGPSSHCLVRSQESGIFHVDQETNSSTGSLVVGIIRVYLLSLIDQESLTEERSLSRRETISWTAIKAISSDNDPIMF
ncbi:hypothetical protein BASA83_013779 [Batrachochytrium salamandrivorans]|nr:hypothetical protein BASA83_013779 [Batrachochytrium salamandrivorans]